MRAKNVIDLLRAAHPGRRYFAKPDYPFITMIKADPKYWSAHGWRVSASGRSVEKIK